MHVRLVVTVALNVELFSWYGNPDWRCTFLPTDFLSR